MPIFRFSLFVRVKWVCLCVCFVFFKYILKYFWDRVILRCCDVCVCVCDYCTLFVEFSVVFRVVFLNLDFCIVK